MGCSQVCCVAPANGPKEIIGNQPIVYNAAPKGRGPNPDGFEARMMREETENQEKYAAFNADANTTRSPSLNSRTASEHSASEATTPSDQESDEMKLQAKATRGVSECSTAASTVVTARSARQSTETCATYRSIFSTVQVAPRRKFADDGKVAVLEASRTTSLASRPRPAPIVTSLVVSNNGVVSVHDKEKDKMQKAKASHILIKHADSEHPVSRRTGMTIELSREGAIVELSDILKKLHVGNFAAIARERSDCASCKNGGDLGCVMASPLGSHSIRKDVKNTFEKVANSLKCREMSAIVETEAGLHVILRTG